MKSAFPTCTCIESQLQKSTEASSSTNFADYCIQLLLEHLLTQFKAIYNRCCCRKSKEDPLATARKGSAMLSMFSRAKAGANSTRVPGVVWCEEFYKKYSHKYKSWMASLFKNKTTFLKLLIHFYLISSWNNSLTAAIKSQPPWHLQHGLLDWRVLKLFLQLTMFTTSFSIKKKSEMEFFTFSFSVSSIVNSTISSNIETLKKKIQSCGRIIISSLKASNLPGCHAT